MAQKQESGSEGGDSATTYGIGQATEAVEKLRTVVDQASRSIKDMTLASEQWAQEHARDAAKVLRDRGGQAVSTVSETVEHNPLTSLAVAFAVGFLVASLIKR